MAKFNATLLPYQEEGVLAIHQHKHFIVADEPGLGKTIQALKACFDMGYRTLIICPAYLRMNWINEIAKFCPYLEYEVVSYSTKILPTGFDAVIVDESSYIKNLKAQRTLNVHKYAHKHKPKYLILLNGSPIMNRVEELYSQVTLVYPNIINLYPSVWSWLNRFSNRKVLKYGSQEYVKYEGVRNVDELKAILKRCMIRRKANSVLSLPPINQTKVVVKYGQDSKLQAEWDKFCQTGVTDGTAKKTSAITKAGFTAQYALDLISSGAHPIVIFSCHPDAVEIIKDDLINKGIRARGIVGNTAMDKREEILQEFIAGNVEVIVASMKAFNTGWTGTVANHMIFNDVDYVPEQNKQAALRIHRIGQEKPVFYHFIVGSKVDERIIDAVASKKEIIQQVMN